MLDHDLVELYTIFKEEQSLKAQMKELSNTLKDVRDEIEEIKTRVADGLIRINHKYAKYEDMEVTLVTKVNKHKLNTEELCSEIEEIVAEENVSPSEKAKKIIESLKPKETGEHKNIVTIKFAKNNTKA